MVGWSMTYSPAQTAHSSFTSQERKRSKWPSSRIEKSMDSGERVSQGGEKKSEGKNPISKGQRAGEWTVATSPALGPVRG